VGVLADLVTMHAPGAMDMQSVDSLLPDIHKCFGSNPKCLAKACFKLYDTGVKFFAANCPTSVRSAVESALDGLPEKGVQEFTLRLLHRVEEEENVSITAPHPRTDRERKTFVQDQIVRCKNCLNDYIAQSFEFDETLVGRARAQLKGFELTLRDLEELRTTTAQAHKELRQRMTGFDANRVGVLADLVTMHAPGAMDMQSVDSLLPDIHKCFGSDSKHLAKACFKLYDTGVKYFAVSSATSVRSAVKSELHGLPEKAVQDFLKLLLNQTSRAGLVQDKKNILGDRGFGLWSTVVSVPWQLLAGAPASKGKRD